MNAGNLAQPPAGNLLLTVNTCTMARVRLDPSLDGSGTLALLMSELTGYLRQCGAGWSRPSAARDATCL